MGEIASRLLSWGVLVVLFGATIALHALAPAGPWRILPLYLVAAVQVLTVIFGFMRLRAASPLVHLAAFSTVVWVMILFGFMSLDYLSRAP